MDARLWSELAELFDQLAEAPESEQRRKLAGLPDAELRRELERMLTAHRGLPLSIEPADGEVTANEQAGTPPVEAIGPYRLVSLLGRGGMGEVWLAERDEPGFRRLVALKRVQGLGSLELLRRFAIERQALARLSHRGIAQLLDGGLDAAGVPFLVLEHVAGEPLTDAADRLRLTVDQRLALFLQVCEAVHYAHGRLVVHRDLKPSNVFLTEAGEVRLLDFGIAKLLDPGAVELGETHTAQRLATPAYASPEQLAGEPVTTATDVHGLGLLLYELLSGRRAFAEHETSASALETAVRGVEPPRPSAAISGNPDAATISAARSTSAAALARTVRGDLDTVVATALRKDPNRRYPSVERLAADVSRWRAGQRILARPDTVAYRARKFVGRHRVAVALAAALVVLLATFGGYEWRQSALRQRQDEGMRTRRQAVQESSRLHTLAVFHYLRGQPGDLEQAEELMREVIAAREAHLPAEHPAVANARSHLARVLVDQGRGGEAIALYRAALEGWTATLGAEHPLVADGLRNLAAALAASGDLGGAEEALRRSLAIETTRVPPTAAAVAATRLQLGEVLLAGARPAEAEPLLRAASGALAAASPASLADAARAQAALGDCLARLGRTGEAKASLRAAVSGYEALAAQREPPHLQTTRALLAGLPAAPP